MIFVGDGYTDIPCFSLIRKNDGVAIGVYDGGDRAVGGARGDLSRTDAFRIWFQPITGKAGTDQFLAHGHRQHGAKNRAAPQYLPRMMGSTESTR